MTVLWVECAFSRSSSLLGPSQELVEATPRPSGVQGCSLVNFFSEADLQTSPHVSETPTTGQNFMHTFRAPLLG